MPTSSSHNRKSYNSFGDHLREHFGEKVYKISIDAGFTCPNRDSTKGTGGCIYCNESGSLSVGVNKELSITKQIAEGKKALFKKYKAKKFIAYFQSFSNTYGDISHLRKIYYEALSIKDIVGISISTRPDTIDNEKLKLISEISKKYYTWLELGLQSSHNKTLEFINRKDTFENFLLVYKKAKDFGIKVCAHIILGLPGETIGEMSETVERLKEMKVDGIKFHLLHIIKGTKLSELYEKGEIKLFTREEYVKLIADIVKDLPPEIVVHRLSAEGPSKDVIAPKWSLDKRGILREIEERLKL